MIADLPGRRQRLNITPTTMQHILIVEDEHHLAIGMKYNFEAEGYLVTTVGDGRTALRMVEADPRSIDLIILDIMLPGMSGYTVCEAIRHSGNDIPILMLTARTLKEDRLRGWEVGTDQYLQKPFELDELLTIVRNLLARRNKLAVQPNADRPSIQSFSFGQAEINFDSYKVTVAGKSLHLTSLEMKLLKYLVEHEGSVITRGELLEHVWGQPHGPTTRTVDNFLLNLRRYFEIDPANPRHFLSVRGTGYRFVAKPEDEPAES